MTFLPEVVWPWLSSQGESRDYKGKEGEDRSSGLDKELAGPGSGAYPQDVPIRPGPGGMVEVGWGSGRGRGRRGEFRGKNIMVSVRQLWAQTSAETLPAVRRWTNYITSLGLSFLLCSKRSTMLPTSPQGLVVRNLGRELGFKCPQSHPKLRRHLSELQEMINLTEECRTLRILPLGETPGCGPAQ